MAALETYRQNPEWVRGWMWDSALSPRTCVACIAMHGSEHALDETLDDHPNGMCTMVPLLTRRAMDHGAEQFPVETAEAWLMGQDPEAVRAILGPARYQAYSEGLPLPALVAWDEDPVWGRSIRVANLAEMERAALQMLSLGPRPEWEPIRSWERAVLAFDRERAVGLNAEGFFAFRQIGGRRFVEPTSAQWGMIADGALIHNHPLSGASFSLLDILAGISNNVAEMRVVGMFAGTRYRHVMTLPSVPPGEMADWLGDVRRVHGLYQMRVHDQMRPLLLMGMITPRQFNFLVPHMIWEGAVGFLRLVRPQQGAWEYWQEEW